MSAKEAQPFVFATPGFRPGAWSLEPLLQCPPIQPTASSL